MIRFRVLEVKKKCSNECNIGKGLNVINYKGDRIMSLQSIEKMVA